MNDKDGSEIKKALDGIMESIEGFKTVQKVMVDYIHRTEEELHRFTEDLYNHGVAKEDPALLELTKKHLQQQQQLNKKYEESLELIQMTLE